MAFIADSIFDNGLAYAQTNGDRIDICSQAPNTYAEATATYSLGNAVTSVGAPANRTPNGRKVTVAAVTGGSVTGDGTASHWALTNGSTELLAWGTLSASQGVTNGNNFDLGSIDIGIPDAA